MMTEAKFKHALRTMILEMPLEEINVKGLCERCHCHRQTFYYHFENIYDLLDAIFLTEEVKGLDNATEPEEVLVALVSYMKENFDFVKAVSASSARDLVIDFVESKITTKLFPLLHLQDNEKLSKDAYRSIARRYAHIVSEEFGQCFKDKAITPLKFERRMKAFVIASLHTVLPALVTLAKEERAR